MTPILYWVRRDFRLSDNAALMAAVERGAPVIPVFICDAQLVAQGAAATFRLDAGLRVFASALEALGSRIRT